MVDFLRLLRRDISPLLHGREKSDSFCFSAKLGVGNMFWVDFRNNQINFFIGSKKEPFFRQILNKDQIDRLERSESNILELLKEYIKELEKNKTIGIANNIVSTAVNKAYDIKTGTVKAPKIMQVIAKRAIDKDFDLDR